MTGVLLARQQLLQLLPRQPPPQPDPPAPQASTLPFTNSTAMTTPLLGSAAPYPSTITVSGLTANIGKVTVTLNNMSHTFPDDVDILLVSPNGTSLIIFSDAGGSPDLTNATITLDDTAPSVLPDSTIISSGTSRPANYGTVQDVFSAPAPVGPYNTPTTGGSATFASVFGGMTPADANGSWSLYVVDDASSDGGSIAGGWTLSITQATTAGQLIISEFRVRGPNGANDECIELYNTTGSALTAQSADGSSGLAVAASNGIARCVVPNGTSIPAFGHYLCVNSVGYSLSLAGDATYTTDIPDNAGIALFNNSTGGGSFSAANRLDAVGPTSEANTTYKEGTGYSALTPFSIDYSFYRGFNSTTGLPTDTGNNSTDFVFVDTNGTSAGAGQRLGAPGPENLAAPTRGAASMSVGFLDSCGAMQSPPNTVRDFTSDPANNSTFGTLDLRRTFTNTSGANLTRLRWRIFNLTTFPAPSGIADLRPRTSSAVVVTVDRPPCGSGTSNVTVQGTTLEQPPSQPNGGGFNSSLSSGTVTLGTPLANGASVDVRFLLGIQQAGCYRLGLLVEALPQGGGNITFVGGHTDGSTLTATTATATAATTVGLSWPAATCAATYDIYYSQTWPTYNYLANTAGLGVSVVGVPVNISLLWAVEGRDSSGAALGRGTADLSTQVLFTDPTLVAGTTTIKAAHINELRTAVNSVRVFSGLSASSFTDTITAGSALIRPYHITELRTALNAARAALGLSAISYTDPSLTVGTTLIKTAHINDLRNGVK